MYVACGFAESHGDTSLLSFAFLVRFELFDPHAAQHSGVTFFRPMTRGCTNASGQHIVCFV